MHEYYYADSANQQHGPVSAPALLAMSLPENTLIWREGLAQWTELRFMMSELQQAMPLQPTPPSVHPSYTASSSSAYGYSSQYAQSAAPAEEPYYNKPDSNLFWAILCTILCCIPFGIVAIIKATKVDTLWNSRQYDAAREAAADAKKWAIWGAILGFIVSMIYGVLVFMIKAFER